MSLRIGTALALDRGSRTMLAQQARADRLLTEVSTGVRVTTPSIDPAAAARAARLDSLVADDGQYLKNAKLAGAMLKSADSALSTMEIGLQRARELAVRASNDTMSAADRRAIAIEIDAIVDDLFTAANTRDGRNQPLFGGTASGDAFVRAGDGTIAYAGLGEPADIPVAPGTSIAAGDSGDRLFGAVDTNAAGDPRSLFGVLADLSAALKDPDLSTDRRRAAIDTGLSGLAAGTDRLAGARASVGARGARLDVETTRLEGMIDDRTIEANQLVGADPQKSILEFQKTLMLLERSQAAFMRISQLNLFDMLR